MKRIESILIGSVVALAVWSCASMNHASSREGEFENLQLFPKNIARADLIARMKIFSRSLGVHCNFCHEGEEGALDFASDAKDEKRNARVMMRMTRAINEEYISKVEGHGTVVDCYTCHRGHTVPEGHLPDQPAAPHQEQH